MPSCRHTKVNRCLSEGRRSFLQRYAEIESGAECERWLPVISAVVDGEATPAQMVEVRPHLRNCPGCRSTLRALHESSEPLSVILPIPFVVVATPNAGEHVSNVLIRLYEMVAGGIHDRAAATLIKTQQVVEATAAGKAAAIAGAAAAVAGGGVATVDLTTDRARAPANKPVVAKPLPPAETAASATPAALPPRVRRIPPPHAATTKHVPTTEFEPVRKPATRSPEFSRAHDKSEQAPPATPTVRAAQDAAPPPPTPQASQTAPEFDASTAPEFRP